MRLQHQTTLSQQVELEEVDMEDNVGYKVQDRLLISNCIMKADCLIKFIVFEVFVLLSLIHRNCMISIISD